MPRHRAAMLILGQVPPARDPCTQLIDSGGTVQDLNSLIPANSGYQITDPTAINDNGQLVASASDATTSYAAVLLKPSRPPRSPCQSALGSTLK
jgi:hypothetical protein